ncbi:MAG TPA: 16S rRNA (cytosine(967)-C(5))-methyltransferase RsmB [Verrucomicrobiae bacterium]
MTGQKPREIALRVLRRCEQSDEYTENLLDMELSRQRLSGPDRGLVQELVYGIVRARGTLDWLIDRKTDGRPQKSDLRLLLRLGLYQLFWLDRIPDHAAVHETVELAREFGYGPQSGFINATLRGYGREKEATQQLLAELKLKDPALGWSQPAWLVEKWLNRFGQEDTQKLLAWNNTAPATFARLNTTRTNAEQIIPLWRAEMVEYDFFTRDWLDEHLMFRFKSHPALETLPSFRQGLFYVQDPSTLLAVRMLDPKPGERILDACAAPGGKATYIAQKIGSSGLVVARDVSEARLKLVKENCKRLGFTTVETDLADEPKLKFRFDRILVDAPCSNTGVLRRRVDLRWRIRAEEIDRLRVQQLELLRKAAAQLAPKGTLIYSTCSLEPEENRDVVNTFLELEKGYKLEVDRELIPFKDGVDGAYVAKLVRT